MPPPIVTLIQPRVRVLAVNIVHVHLQYSVTMVDAMVSNVIRALTALILPVLIKGAKIVNALNLLQKWIIGVTV